MIQYADLDLIARLKRLDMVRVAEATKQIFVVVAAVVPVTQEPLGHVINNILLYSTGPLVENSAGRKVILRILET